MTDDELSRSLGLALALGESDRTRLAADFALRKEEDDARIWRIVFRAVKHSQWQLNATLNRSRAATQAAHTLLSKG